MWFQVFLPKFDLLHTRVVMMVGVLSPVEHLYNFILSGSCVCVCVCKLSFHLFVYFGVHSDLLRDPILHMVAFRLPSRSLDFSEVTQIIRLPLISLRANTIYIFLDQGSIQTACFSLLETLKNVI